MNAVKLKPNQALLNIALSNDSDPKTKKNQKKVALKNGQ
jgi:hypothetical protein